jgi:hypothetical protein
MHKLRWSTAPDAEMAYGILDLFFGQPLLLGEVPDHRP